MKHTQKLFITFLAIFIAQISIAQWTQLANLLGNARSKASCFVIGNSVYVIGGSNSVIFKDVWEYNVATNNWTQKSIFIGTPRHNAVAFSINGKGYYGLGIGSLGNHLADLWEYNPITDTWTQKASLPALSRESAVGFSIGSKGYVGSGTLFNFGNNTPFYLSDFWEYNPANNSWTQKANIPGQARANAVGIELNGKGYFGLGQNTNLASSFNDFYEYDPTTNSWTTKQSMTGQGRRSTSAFTFGGEIVIVGGYDLSPTALNSYSTCMKYNPATNAWSNAASFSGGTIGDGVAATFSNTAFIGIGYNSTLFQSNNDWWQYTPITSAISSNSLQNSEIQIYPTPANDVITISIPKGDNSYLLELYDVTGKIVTTNYIENNTTLTIKELSNGIYTYFIKSNITNQNVKKGRLVVNH